jgi:hypothetical protein
LWPIAFTAGTKAFYSVLQLQRPEQKAFFCGRQLPQPEHEAFTIAGVTRNRSVSTYNLLQSSICADYITEAIFKHRVHCAYAAKEGTRQVLTFFRGSSDFIKEIIIPCD